MIELPLCIYFGFKINGLAKRKNQNAPIWIGIAILSFFAAYVAGMMVLMAMFYKGGVQPSEMMAFFQNPVRMIFVWFSGFGGYLLVKYILERMPDKGQEKKKEE